MQTINVVWLKRDLRLTDHQPLTQALSTKHPTVLLYIVEPLLLNNPHYSERHWRFVWQSLQDMDETLKAYGHRITVLFDDALACFQSIQAQYQINAVFSHQEIGLNCTFERDRQVAAWLYEQNIDWFEFEHGAVIRGAKNRQGWDKHWDSVMRASISPIELQTDLLHSLDAEALGCSFSPPSSWLSKCKGMQTGGSRLAWKTLEDFFIVEVVITIEAFLVPQPHAQPVLDFLHTSLGVTYPCVKFINTF